MNWCWILKLKTEDIAQYVYADNDDDNDVGYSVWSFRQGVNFLVYHSTKYSIAIIISTNLVLPLMFDRDMPCAPARIKETI